MKVISTGVSLSIVDKLGRKKCLIFGVSVMAIAVLTLGIFAITDGSEASRQTCHEVFWNTTSNSSSKPLEIYE